MPIKNALGATMLGKSKIEDVGILSIAYGRSEETAVYENIIGFDLRAGSNFLFNRLALPNLKVEGGIFNTFYTS